MRKLLTFLIALGAMAFGVCQLAHSQGLMTMGAGSVRAAPPPSGCTNLVTVDGPGESTAGSTTTSTVTITTTHTNDLIILADQFNSAGITSIVDTAGLTWVQVGSHTGTMSVYSAFSSGVLTSDTITITYNSPPGFDSIVVFGLNGVPTSNYFDPNGALPGTTTTVGTPLTLTTSNACDFLFAAYADNTGAGIAPGAGWSLISGSGGNFMGVIYKLVTATQSATPAAVSGGTTIKNGVGSAVKSQ
jgi:hypothetical protein